ncbi:MAG: WecB/TagA/CpsF family glycosyltransferase [Roseburia inulinivorans]
METCNILGTNIVVTNMEDIVYEIENNIDELRGKYICVSNVHTTIMAYENAEYRKIQNNAAYALPDGKPLSVYSKMHGFSGAERVTGPDLMDKLFSRDNGLKHYFYGGREETLMKLKQRLPQSYKKIKIVGMCSPPFRKLTSEEDEESIKKMRDSGADIIWIGLGAPKQEFYMSEHCGKVDAVMIGVGAGFDYHAGAIKRAPTWMQRLSLEWLYRLIQDPKRLFKRYLVTNIKFLWLTRGLRR